MKNRHFTVPEGRHLTLPVGLLPAPGAQNLRVAAGEVITLDDDDPRTKQHQRFISNRIKLGDLVEVEEKFAATAPRPQQLAASAPAPAAPAKPFEVNPPALAGGK